MFELILLSIALIGSFAAGLYDLKTSNIPDKVCIAMIILGLLIHLCTGFVTNDFTNLMNSLFFGGMFLAFGLAMYYTGQWGGGDGELLIAVGVLLPNLSLVKTYFPFAVSFFINSFFVGAIYSVIFSFYVMHKNHKISRKFLDEFKDDRTKLSLLFFTSLSVIFLLSSKTFLFLIFLMLSVIIIFQKFAKYVEEGFLRRIPVSRLKVDDTIGEDIPKLGIYKKLIKGLSKEQIRKIKQHKRYVVIREGIRYGIVFPLTLAFTLLFGDFIFFFL